MRPTKLRHLALLFFGALFLMQALRLAFVGQFGSLEWLGTKDGLHGLYLGLKFDLRLAAILVAAPWVLLNTGEPSPPRRLLGAIALAMGLMAYLGIAWIGMVDDKAGRAWLAAFLLLTALSRFGFPRYGLQSGAEARWMWRGYAMLCALFLLACYACDFGSYSYNRVRLNGTVLGFLQNPLISARMVWQSYPVLRGAMAMALPLLLLHWGLKRMHGWNPVPRWINLAVSVGLVLCMWGKLSRYPLRWGEAFDGRRPFAAQMALNPVLSFLETRVIRDGGVDMETVKSTHAAMAEYFGVAPSFDAQGAPMLLRTIEPRPQVMGTPNVVFIQLESLSAFKTSMLGNPLDPTPFLKHLSDQGLFFDRFFVAMENTSRSMFATLFGIPDVSPVEMNATRNPLLVEQHCLVNALEGYEKFYFLGGSANWAQIRAATRNNIPGLRILEEGSYQAPVVDVWGVSDADLLLEGYQTLRRQGKPYFAYFQTSGNHPPFTIPKHFPDFPVLTKPAADLARGGFISNAEYNAVRLMDDSVRKFFEAAEKDPGYRNTVYVLWADHGIPRGTPDSRFGQVPLAIQHIPLIIFAPGFIQQPRRIHTVGMQTDILPTVMSLLGRRVRTQTLGKDLLDPAYGEKACAFTFSTWQRPATIGLIRGQDYLIHHPDGRSYLYDLQQPMEVDRKAERPQDAREMLRLARGFQAWSQYLMTRNKPLE